GQFRAEPDVVECRWQDAPPHGQDSAGLDDSLLEAAGNLSQRGDEEIAEEVAAELRAFLVESIREELADRRLRVRERDQATSDIAGSRNVELLADAAGAATVVRHRHNRRNPGFNVAQTAKERRESGASADCHDVHSRADRAEAVRGDNR